MSDRKEPSPEVKKILGEFCRLQREKYGPDWKRVLAGEMAEQAKPGIEAILRLQKALR